MLKKFKYFKINEHIDTTSVISASDPEILKLKNIVEDSFEKAIISHTIYDDTFNDVDDFPIKKSSMSILFRIKCHSLSSFKLGNGSPYTTIPTDFYQASEKINSLLESKKVELSLVSEMKSLLYRLEKIGYKISNLAYSNTSGYDIYEFVIIIQDKKLIF